MNGKYICFTLLDISSNIYIYLFGNAAAGPTQQENIHQMKERNFLCKNCKSKGSRCVEWKERSQILNISKSATINIQGHRVNTAAWISIFTLLTQERLQPSLGGHREVWDHFPDQNDKWTHLWYLIFSLSFCGRYFNNEECHRISVSLYQVVAEIFIFTADNVIQHLQLQLRCNNKK